MQSSLGCADQSRFGKASRQTQDCRRAKLRPPSALHSGPSCHTTFKTVADTLHLFLNANKPYKYMTVRKKYSGRHQYYKHYCISRKVFLKLLPTWQRCQKNNRHKNESDYKMFHRASANQFRFDTFIEVRPLAVLTINGTSPRQRVDRVVIIRVPCSRFFALSMPSKN